jgi:inner membrane protein
MNPATHLLVGWSVANTAALERRDRALVTLAGVIPDVDGLGIFYDWAARDPAGRLTWWWEFHHTLAHNIAGAAVVVAIALCLAKRTLATACLAAVSFHLHLLGDIAGSRGPDGYQWPVPYLRPFSDSWQLTWSGQWELDAWPNFAITAALLALALWLAWKRGRSPLELVSSRADRAFVTALRNRFGSPFAHAEGGPPT